MAGQVEQWDEHIEGIVRDVLARLQDGNLPAPAVPLRSTSGAYETNGSVRTAKTADLVLAEAVVTLATIDGRLDGVRKVTVQPGAVVTPAVRDLLRERGIVLSRSGEAVRNDQSSTATIVGGVAACRAEPVSGRRLEEVLGVSVEVLARVGLVDVVREMSEQIVLGGKRGILFTSETAAAVCLANRRRGVRAVTARDAEEAAQASASVGANLLVLRPDGCSTWTQLRMAREFINCKARCPAAYAEALD